MKKGFLLLFTLIAFSACTSTEIYTRLKCHICLSQSDGVLLLPLPWDSGFSKLSPGEQAYLESQVLEILRDKGFTKVELYDRLEHELFSAGITDPNDPEQRAKVNSALGYPYFLGIALGETRNSDEWNYRSEQQLYEMSPPAPDMEISATIRVALIETASGNIVSDNAIITKISDWGTPDEDGGVNFWNFGSVSQAIRKATSKGVANMVKECGC
ncbi:hypothetical protein SAMN04489724_3543 [Algoriphagus locisalis]|uniref:DUF4136 domain-containing protein n=1 Tax=Algoriphagus locisalis TaxID=305507 RepID=A0A1I7CXC0_9BACT|nr:hypothetical protein [Algoriphagus locisalis]SFU04074.1 hypothetical protein SAMN04489724_3543 [Algoriphagus locisalis]